MAEKTIIKKPWEEEACPKCAFCVQEDMCCAIKFYSNNGFCPQIRDCDEFFPKKENDNGTY